MTTSSFDRSRCTRISPSAILDDRLAGKDLEWARDHLRRCEACRDRVEDFREMLLRVGRLPSATVSAAAMDDAYATSIPDRLRGSVGTTRTFQSSSSVDSTSVPPAAPFTELAPLHDLPPLNDLSSHLDLAPQSVRPEVTSLPDLLSELEREIFRDELAPEHPAPMTSVPEPIYPTLAEAPVEEVEAPTVASSEPARVMPPHPEMDELADSESTPPAPPEVHAEPLREVPIDSRRGTPPTNPSLTAPARSWELDPALPARGWEMDEDTSVLPSATIASVDEEPEPTAPPKKSDNAMRLAVGLGAAATVLLAAVLYEGGWVLGSQQKAKSATSPIAAASIHPSPTARVSASPSATPTATAPPAPVLFTLGNGVAGNTIFRIRLGTAVAGYTRLVFDMHGSGLPSMVITQPDNLHVAVTFKNTDATGLPVGGIHTSRVAGVESPVQQGADAIITIDLVHPVTVNAFTLPATGSYAWRLVVDLHS